MSSIFGFIPKGNTKIADDAIAEILSSMSKRGKEPQIKSSNHSLHINSGGYKFNNVSDLYSNENYLINFDGRIENRNNLITELGLLKEISDAELALTLYIKEKQHCLKKIIGCFSFIIYEIKTKKIFIGKDHLGIIPVYYVLNEKFFMYGTEPKLIFLTNLIKKEINKNRVKNFIIKSQEYYDECFFSGMHRPLAAHYTYIQDSEIKEKRYFKFTAKINNEAFSNDEWIYDFRTKLAEAIDQMVLGNKDIGLSLSGGLDSNTILGLARSKLVKNKIDRIGCYYARFIDLKGEDYENSNEDYFVTKIPTSEKIKINHVDIEDTDVIKEINANQKDKPEPDYDATRHVQTRVNKACKNDGFNIIFTGFDGDTVVSHGYESIFYEVMRGNFFVAYKEYSEDRFRKKIDSRAIDFIWRFIIESYTPYFIKHLYKLAKRDLLQHHAAFFASEEVRNTIKYKDNKRIYSTNGRLLSHQSDIFNSRFWQHHFEMLDTDIAYMGMEYRHPFMNREFMSLCLNIPFKLRRSDGLNRFIMREAIKEYAPTEIVSRVTKSHVGEYYNYSFEKNFEDMKEQILNSSADINEYLDIDRIKNFNFKDPSNLRKISFQHICTLANWHDSNNFDKL